MKARIIEFGIACIIALRLTSAAPAAEAPPTLDVWPAQPPGNPQPDVQEKWEKKRVTNVTHPTLEVFRPADNRENSGETGVAVIVCPGGGYQALMMDYEGEDVARWLNTIGVTGIVLKYRVPAPQGLPRYLPALQDAQRSMSLVRSKAKQWGIDPHRIGMLGFSAGGHLVAATSTNFDKRQYEAVDAVDDVSNRPDFAMVIYPGGIVNKSSDQLSPEIRPSAQTPPTFIVQANDDPVGPRNSVFLYLALKQAGVPAELHVYATGGHGFGLKKSDKPCSTWPDRLTDWLYSQKILSREKKAQQ